MEEEHPFQLSWSHYVKLMRVENEMERQFYELESVKNNWSLPEILLRNEKKDDLVELTLPKDSNIYASKYQLYLPDKKVLKEKLKEWMEEDGGAIDD